MGPRHVHPLVQTVDDYAQRQRQAISRGRANYPNMPWRDPWTCDAPAVAFVSGGAWQVPCACGNCPSASPEWRTARCFECGAVYFAVQFPRDLEEIERLLVLRPSLATRNWTPAETMFDLKVENEQHGICDPTEEPIS